MDTQEIIDTNMEESHIPSTGLDEIEAAMQKISELEKAESEDSASEEKEEKAYESKTDEIKPKTSDATSKTTTEEVEDQEENAEPTSTGEEQSAKSNKLWHEKKLKFKAIAEKEAIAAENEKLRKMLDEALDSGSYHHAKSVEAEISMAKDLRRKAIESGDIDSMFKADEAYNKALIAKHEIDKWNYQQSSQKPTNTQGMQTQSEQVSQANTLSPLQQTMAQEWVEAHPELNPESRSYDKHLAEKVAPYINNLESNINQSGQLQYLYSSEFFDMIDNYIDKIKTPRVSNPPLSSNNVAGVKKSYQGSSTAPPSAKKQVVLTADEKIMAANAGVSEKDWLKYKIEELNKGK